MSFWDYFFNSPLPPEDRIAYIEKHIDHHGRDDLDLKEGWRLNCRNRFCKERSHLLSINKNDFAKDDGNPFIIHGFVFCENCANVIRTGKNLDGTPGMYIDLDKSDLSFYEHEEVKEMYALLYGKQAVEK